VKRRLIAAIGVAGMLVSIAACGSGDDGGKDKKAGADGYKCQTLTVWAMDGSTPDTWQKDVTAAFEK
jgi:N,N'-diacetylchitobiose transport system substrate-binding protein